MLSKIWNQHRDIQSLFQKDAFLYTMGKAGSNSISYSLEKAGLTVGSKHFFSGDQHNFFNNNNHNFAGKLRKKYVKTYLAKLNRKIKIITLVRDPLARNLSMAFFALETLLYKTLGPADQRNLKGNHLSLNEIIELGFFEQLNHQAPFNWFEEEFNYVLNLDVYHYPFDKKKGYTHITSGNVEVLILKLEKLNMLEAVVGDFLKLNSFQMLSANRSENYWYASLYTDFKKEFNPSQEYLDWMYQSKYCQHFYSPEEIAAFYQRWQKND